MLTAQLDAIFQAANRSDAPGLIVGIARHGEVIYRRAFGLASVQHGVANRPTTRMRIASISKHFTCLAALLLVEEGRLDIDAPISRYLPEAQALRGMMPTLRQFMQHTSGYRCTLDMGTLANGLAVQPGEWQLDALLRQSEVNFAPGQGQMYSNGTYHALSLVIEQVAGLPFEQFLKQRIFEPLGMHDTDSVPDDMLMLTGMASSHVPAPGGGWVRGAADSELRGDGGMVSTVDDMLRWLAHLNGPKKIGSAETWRQMLEPAVLANGLVSTYALGLKRHDYRGVEVIHHSGGLFGLNAQMLTVPSHGLDVIILVNGAPLSASALSWKVVDAVLAEHLKAVPRTPASITGFEHLVGARYQSAAGLLIGFNALDDKLAVSLLNMQAMPILYDEGTHLRAGFEAIGLGPYMLAKTDLAAVNGHAPEQLVMNVSGEDEVLLRLPLQAPSVEQAVPPLVGRYWSEDLQAQAEITEDFVLRMKGDYSAARSLSLEPFSHQLFGIEELKDPGTRYPLTAHFENREVTGFWIDTFRARRIWFARQQKALSS